MSAPIAVNTADGTCWTRRGALRGGEALYAPEGVCSCPEFVMATLAELAEHGIVGSADALPMPVGTEPSPFDGFRIVVEVANADGRGDAEWAAELVENALEGQGFKASVTVDEGAQDVAALRALVAGLEADRAANDREYEAATARIAELESLVAEAVSVSETLSRALHEEQLAGSALYAALTMPTTPEQRQAALDRFTAVAQRNGQKHAPTAHSELVRADHFTEAARLLEDTGRDDDAVNLLDNVADGIRTHAADVPHEGPPRHAYRLGRDLPETGGAPC